VTTPDTPRSAALGGPRAQQTATDPERTARPATIDLEAVEARANAATPGPWWVSEGADDYGTDVFAMPEARDPLGNFVCRTGKGFLYDAGTTDAEFIAYAREDVPALVAAVRALEGECERLHEEVEARDRSVVALKRLVARQREDADETDDDNECMRCLERPAVDGATCQPCLDEIAANNRAHDATRPHAADGAEGRDHPRPETTR
jgi:hypothetical protein